MRTRVKALKVKIKTMAVEAAVIRREEAAALGKVVDADGKVVKADTVEVRRPDTAPEVRTVKARCTAGSGRTRKWADPALHAHLHDHRIRAVRAEQRCNLLAYGFLRGKTYAQVEPGCKTLPSVDRVFRIVDSFGATSWDAKSAQDTALMQWFREGGVHVVRAAAGGRYAVRPAVSAV